jgi:hypothetical protein
VVGFTPRPLYPSYPLDRRQCGTQNRSGRGEEKIFAPTGTRTPTSRSSSPYPVGIPTALSRLVTLLNLKCIGSRVCTQRDRGRRAQRRSAHRLLCLHSSIVKLSRNIRISANYTASPRFLAKTAPLRSAYTVPSSSRVYTANRICEKLGSASHRAGHTYLSTAFYSCCNRQRAAE